MESLVSLARTIEPRQVTLPDGATVVNRALPIRFSRATPDRLPEGTLPRTYTSKPLVSVNGAAMFGELAIVRWLEKDGWDAVWMDTFHGAKFWRAMPHKSAPVTLPPGARAVRCDQGCERRQGERRVRRDGVAQRRVRVRRVQGRGRPTEPERGALDRGRARGWRPADAALVRAAPVGRGVTEPGTNLFDPASPECEDSAPPA